MNSATTGIATAFSLKTVVTAVVSLGVAAVVAVGGYSVASNYILFPEFNEALANTMEAKTEPLTEFDTEKFLEEGKTEVALDIPELDLDASFSLSHSEKALQAALTTCGETFTVSYKDLNVAASAEGFNDGKAYGFSLKKLRDDIMDSVFAADSGTDYEIPMNQINDLCDMVEMFTEPKEVSKEYERAYEFVMKVFEKSEMAKDAQVSYSKLEVLGEERSGRSQTLTINQDYIVKLIEDYAEAFDEAKGKDLEAIEYVLDDLKTTFDIDIDVDDIVDALEEAADLLGDVDELEGLEIKYSVLYVQKYLSAIVASVEYSMDIGEDEKGEIVGTVTVDFGEKPNKTRDITVNVDLTIEGDGQKGEVYAELVFDSKKDGDEIVYSIDLEAEADIPEMDKQEIDGKAEFVLNNEDGKAFIAVSGGYNGEDIDIFYAEFKFSDSKDKLSFTPVSFEIPMLEQEFEMPFDVTVSLYKKPDSIKANKYENVLKMDEDEVSDLVDDLEDYAKDLVKDFEEWTGAFEDFEDLFDGFGGTAEPDWDEDWDSDWDGDWDEDRSDDDLG